MDVRQRIGDLARRFDEVDTVIIMLVNAGRDRKDVRIEDDVFRREANLLGQNLVSAGTDFDLALFRVGLSRFVKCHNDNCSTIGTHQTRMMQEGFFAFFERNRVDDRLALNAFQASFDHVPLGAVDHYRNARDIRLCRDQVEIFNHDLLAVDQTFIHVDVDDLCAVFHLITRHIKRCRIIASLNELTETGGAGNVRPFADIDERNILGQREWLKARQTHQRRHLDRLARGMLGDSSGYCTDMLRRRTTATAHHIDEAFACKVLDLGCHSFRAFVILAELVWQASIRIGADKCIGNASDFREMFAHCIGTERAIEPDGERLGMAQ